MPGCDEGAHIICRPMIVVERSPAGESLTGPVVSIPGCPRNPSVMSRMSPRPIRRVADQHVALDIGKHIAPVAESQVDHAAPSRYASPRKSAANAAMMQSMVSLSMPSPPPGPRWRVGRHVHCLKRLAHHVDGAEVVAVAVPARSNVVVDLRHVARRSA